jgi:hypothetical protein
MILAADLTEVVRKLQSQETCVSVKVLLVDRQNN